MFSGKAKGATRPPEFKSPTPKTAEEVYLSHCREFYTKQAGLYALNEKILKELKPALDYLNKHSPEDGAWLEYYLSAYRALDHNPFQEHDPGVGAGIDQQVKGICDGFFAPDEEVLTDQIRENFDLFAKCIFNYSSFHKFLNKLIKSDVLKSQRKLVEAIEKSLAQDLITAVQHAPRYGLSMGTLIKEGGHFLSDPVKARMELIAAAIKIQLDKINANMKSFDGEAEEKENVRRYRHSRMEVLSQEELTGMVAEMKEYLNEAKRDHHYQRLNDLFSNLNLIRSEKLNDEQTMVRVKEAIILPYLDIYLEERSKGYLGHTSKGLNLTFLEGLFKKYDLMEVGAMDKKEDKLDARIFKAFEGAPAKINAAVRLLFLRAMSEGIGGAHDKMIYVNARKAINRMGDRAIAQWNQQVQGRFGDSVPTVLLMNEGKMEAEATDISNSYDELFANQAFKAELNKVCHIEILASAFRENLDNREIIEKLQELAKRRDDHGEDVSVLVHLSVMEPFIKTHLAESSVGLFGGAKQDLKKMIAAIYSFQQRTGSELFGKLRDKASEAQLDKDILHSVGDYLNESQEFARQLFEHAINIGFGSLDSTVANSSAIEAKKRKLYVKDVQTVIDMGEPAIKAWNQLALKFESPRIWADLIIQNSNRQEERFDKLHSALVKNPDFLEKLKTRVATRPSDHETPQPRMTQDGGAGRQH